MLSSCELLRLGPLCPLRQKCGLGVLSFLSPEISALPTLRHILPAGSSSLFQAAGRSPPDGRVCIKKSTSLGRYLTEAPTFR